MKFFANFFLTKHSYYCKEANTQEMWILGAFFTSEIGCSPVQIFIDLLDDPDILGIDGNVTSIDLMLDRTIEICDLLPCGSNAAFILPKE